MENIDDIAKRHNQWVDAQGWHNTTTLERLALVASEIGEAVNECRGEHPTEKYPDELADIILRVLDMMIEDGMVPSEVLTAKMNQNFSRKVSPEKLK